MALELHIHKPEDATVKTNHYYWDRTKSNPAIIAASSIQKHTKDNQRIREAMSNRNILLFANRFKNKRLALEIANAFKTQIEKELML